MLTGAIFDLDGTLLDSMFIWDTIGEDYLRTLGKEPHENLKETFMTLTLEEAAEYYREHYKVTLSVTEIVDSINAMVEGIYRTKVTLKPGVMAYLRLLKERGVKMCVATVTDRYLVEDTLERLGILHYFSEIFTCEGWSVTIDGTEATPLRVNYVLRAVEVPEGNHIVEWSYRAPAWNITEGITLLCSLVIIFGCVAALIIYILKRWRTTKE